MIDEKWRYFSFGGLLTPGGPSRWDVLDWDQRRTISVILPNEEEDYEVAINHLRQHVDKLDSDVFAITISEQNELTVSKDPEDDETEGPHYPALDEVECAPGIQIVHRGQLREIDRLGPNVDLVSNTSGGSERTRKVVFKYYFMDRFLFRRWDELNIWMRLPSHPFIVPFDRVVVDELEGREIVVGFTSVFIPGGTVDENISRTFKLKWLKQLICAVDDLNLKFGIQHQDIAPRNLLVDEDADKLLRGPRRRQRGFFTLYEIITRATHFTEVPHHEQDSTNILKMERWQQHPQVQLDHPVSEFRSVLDSWVNSRREAHQIRHYTEASEYIDWPNMKPPPQDDDGFVPDSTGYQSDQPAADSTLADVDDFEDAPSLCWATWRRDNREQGLEFLKWQRPPQSKLPQVCYVLASGAVVPEEP